MQTLVKVTKKRFFATFGVNTSNAMLNALDGSSYNFPTEFVNPKEKEKSSYGLAYAKAMYNCGTRYGGTYYTGTADMDALTELAQGNQSVNDIRKLFGFNNNDQGDLTNDLAYIDPKVLNLAPKYINRAVAKMQRMAYDIGLECIDPVSIDQKKDYADSLKAFYDLKEWMRDMNYNPQVMFPELEVDSLPLYPDEMLYNIAVNPKIKREIAGELMIKLLHSINRFDQKMRELDWDLAVYGFAHAHCYDDANGIPREDRINHKFWIGSYVDNDDFEDQEYAGFFDFITVNQFIKDTAKELTADQQIAIVQQHCNKNPQGSFVDYKRLDSFDGLGYIPVLRFYFRSEDTKKYTVGKTSSGRPVMDDRDITYEMPDHVTDSRLVENCYTSVYGGTWVLDSDVVYNYRRLPYPRQELVNATLPIKTFATNFKEGRAVSFLAQMKEPLFMINTAWNKIKQILAEGRMGVMEIDFNQIENVALGKGGQQWTPKDVVTFLFKKNILIKRGAVNQYNQKIDDAIRINTGGLQLADYFTAFTTGIQMLEQMTNSSVLEQMDVPDRLAAKNAEMSMMQSDTDMEYLYNGHKYFYERVSHQMLLIAQGSISQGKAIKGFIPALGKVNMGFFESTNDLAYCEYGMYMTRQANQQEKQLFYNDVSIALEQGRISAADSAFIRDIDNLKQARYILSIRETIYQREQQKIMQQNMQMQSEMNSQSAAESLQSQMALQASQGEIDSNIEMLRGKISMALQTSKDRTTLLNSTMKNRSDREKVRRQSTDSVIKEGLRNIPEKQKAVVDVARLDIDREKLEVEREKIQAMKSRPKSSSK